MSVYFGMIRASYTGNPETRPLVLTMNEPTRDKHLLRELAADLGDEAAAALARTYGGAELYIPQKARANHKIARAVGVAVLGWLSANYGGEKIVVPIARASPYNRLIAQLSEAICRLIKEGKRTSEIVREVGCHERTVRLWRAKIRERRLARLRAKVAASQDTGKEQRRG